MISYCPKDKADWRNWLKENHLIKDSIWLIFNKKKTPNPNLTWSEAVDEALCFGWIIKILILSFLTIVLLGCKEDKPYMVNVDLPLTKIVWKGIHLPIEINSSKANKHFSIKLNAESPIKAEISRRAKNQFTIFANKRGKLKIDVFLVEENREEYLFSETLKVKEIPNLKPSFCPGMRLKVSDAMLINNYCKKISVETINYDINANFKVIGFDIVTYPLKKGRTINSSKNNLLTELQIQQIKEVNTGEFIYVENISVEISGEILVVEIMKIEKI